MRKRHACDAGFREDESSQHLTAHASLTNPPVVPLNEWRRNWKRVLPVAGEGEEMVKFEQRTKVGGVGGSSPVSRAFINHG